MSGQLSFFAFLFALESGKFGARVERTNDYLSLISVIGANLIAEVVIVAVIGSQHDILRPQLPLSTA